jgi:thermostable 8-oxoguanine DNA glycosylase
MKAQQFFHIPLDSKVFAVLKQNNIEIPKSIKTINASLYRKIQQSLRNAAQKKGVDPLRFDDYAWAHMD